MSDEYNFDDFEDFDSEQKETAKAHGKSAKSYARNVLKSAKYIGLDVIKNFDPDIRDFLSDTTNIFTDMYDVVENAKKTVKDTINKILGSDSSTLKAVKQIAKNTFDDLRTGQFYNQERQDAIFNDMFGGDMSFGWDDDSKDSDDDSDSKKESKDISNTEMTNRISSSQQLSGMNTASMIIANDNKNTKISMSANMQMFNATNQTLLGINTSLVNIQQGLVNPLQNHIQNFNKFATVATEQLAKQTKYLSILASQIQKKNNDKQVFGENKELNSYNDIFGFGALPNLYNWANHVKEKIKQESSTLTSMAEFLSPEMVKMFVSSFTSSPIATLLSMATSGALKATFVGKEVEKTKRIVKNSILQAAFGIHEERLNGSDGIIGYLARLLDIIPNTNYKTSFSKYNKSASEWTGKDQKALRDVIPTQLSTIISILSGTEAKIFDYDRGRWYTATNYQKVFQKDKASQVMSDTEIKNLKDEIIKDIIIERNEELIKTKGNDAVAETSSGKFARTLQQDFDTLINLFALRNIEVTAFSTKQEFLKVIDKYNWANDPQNRLISKESVQRIANIIFANPSTTVRFKDGIIRGKIARAKYIDQLSSSNNSVLNIINNSGIADAHKLGSNRFGSDILIKTVDENKHNIFYYLSEILNNIKNISVSSRQSRTIYGASESIRRKISQANKTANTNQNTTEKPKDQPTKNVDDYDRRKLDPNSKYYDPDYASEIAVMRDRYIDLGDELGYGQIVEKTTEDGTVIFKQVDTSSNYTKAAEYVDRLKRDRAVSKGTIDYIEDYDKKRTKGLIQTVLEDFNKKLESLAYGDMSKALREKYKDAHGFTGVMERTGQIIKEQFQKLSNYFKGLWEKFKVSEWGENFFGTLKKKGKNLGSSIWDYIKERTFDIIEGITGTRPGSGKQEDFSGVNNEKNDKKRAANPSQAATGGVVKKSGMASVSEGEIIIPANKNPYYEDRLSLAQRQRIENKNYMAWVDDGAPGGPYFGNFAKGTNIEEDNLHLDNTGIQRITLNNILKYNLQTLLKLSHLLPMVNRLNDRELYKNIFTNFSSEDQDILRRTMQSSDFDKLIDSNKSNTRLLDISDRYNKLLADEQKIQLRFPFRLKLNKLLYRWVKNIKELPDDTVTRLVDLLKPELDLRAVYENKPLDQISKKDIDDVGKSLQKLYKNNALRQARYDFEIVPGSDVDFINRMEDATLKSVTQSIQNNQPPTEKQNEISKPVTQSIQNNQPPTEKQNEISKPVTQSIQNNQPPTEKQNEISKPVTQSIPVQLDQNNQPSTTVALGDISTRILKKYGPTILTLLATGGLGYGAYHFSPQILDYGSQILNYLRQPGISSLTTGLISGIYSGLKSKRWSTGLLSGALGGLVPAVIDGLNPLQNINPEMLNQVSTGAIDLAKFLSYLGVSSGSIMGAVTASSKFNPVTQSIQNNQPSTKKKYGNMDIVKYGSNGPAYATIKELKDLGYDSSNPEKLIDTISKYDYNKLHAEGIAQQIIKDHKNDEWLYKRSGRWFGNDNNERIIAKRIIYRLNTGDSINTLVSENDTSFLNYIKDKSKKIRKVNPKATDEEIIENISKNIKTYSRDFDKMHDGDFHVSNEAAILFKILFSEDIYIARAQEKQNELLKEIEGKKKSLEKKKLVIFNKSISAIKQDFDPRYNITPYIQNEALKYLSQNENIDTKELTNFMKNSFDGRANIQRLIETNIDKNILESHDINEIFKYLNDNKYGDNLSFLYNIFDISHKDPILKRFIKNKYYSKYKDQNIDFKHLILDMYNDYRPDMLSQKDYLSNKYNVKDKYERIVLGSSSIYDNDRQMSFKEYQRLIQQAKNDKKMQNAIRNSFYKYNMDREEIWNALQRLGNRNWESLSETDKDLSVLNRFDPIRTVANTFDKLFGTIANQNVDLKKLTVSTLDTFKKDYAWITGSSLIGGVIGALATGSPLGVLGGLVIGGGLEVVDRSKQWTDILYGKKNEKTGRYAGGFLSPKIATFMKEKMPNMAKAGAIGGGIGMLFGGPLGVLGGITLGSGLEYLRASTDFKEYFFGKDEISGKSKWDKTYEFIKKHNFGLKGATLGGTIGMYMGGPVGLLGGSLIGAATEYLSGATGLTNALLGTKDIHGHRQGGLIGTLNYMFGSIPEKILNQLSVIPNTFKDMSVNIGKLAYQAIARPVGNYFKDLGKWVYRGIVGAVKNKIARISQTWIGKLFNPVVNASRKLFGFIYDYSIGGLLNLPTKLMDWAKSGAEKAEKSLKLTHDVTDFLAGKYRGEMTPELLQRLQEHYSTMDQNKLKSDQSYGIYRLFDNNEENENRFTNQSDEDIQKTLELGKSYIDNLDAIHKQKRDRGNLFRLIESTIKSNNTKYSIKNGNDTNAFWNKDREILEQIFNDLGDNNNLSDFDEKLESFLTKQGVPLEDIDIIKTKAKELIDSKIDLRRYDNSLLGKSEKNKNLLNWIERNGSQIFNVDKNGNFIINERKYGQMKDRYNSMVSMMMAGREKRLEEIENKGNETVENASHNSYDQVGIVWDTMKDWMDENLKGISTEISAIKKFFTGTGDSKEVFNPKESAAVKLLSEAIKIAYDNIQKEKQGLNVDANNAEEKESNNQSAEQPTQTNTQSKQDEIYNVELIEGSNTAENIKDATVFGLGSGIGGDSSINTRIPRDISASVNTTPQGTTVNITNVIPPPTVTAPAPSQTNQTQNTNISNNTSGVTKVEFFEGQPIQYVRTNTGDWTYNLQDRQTRETVAYIRRRNQAFENLANGNITINNGNGQNSENNSTTGESNNTEGSVDKSILSQLVGGFNLFSKLITPITIGSTVFLPWIAKQFAGGSYDPGMYKGADPGERAKQIEKQNIFERMSSGVRTIDNVILGKDMTTYREGDYVSEGIFSSHSENKSEDLISNKYTNKIVQNFFDPRTGKYMPMIEKLSNIKYVGNIFKPLKWAGQANQYIREGKLGELWKNTISKIKDGRELDRIKHFVAKSDFKDAEKKLIKLKNTKATGLLDKTSLFINKISQSIEVGLKKIIYKLSEFKGLARLKIRAKTMDFGKWVKKLLAPISEHTLMKTIKNIGGKALHALFHTPVLNWIFVSGAVADCLLNGSFRTRVVLGILTQPTLGEKVLAAILHGFNEWIPWIGGLIPTKYYVDWGMKLLQFLLGWTFGDLGKKRRAAKKEVDQYNKDNGTTYDIEEYIANVKQDKPWLENSWIGKSWNWATTNMTYGWDYMMGNDLTKYAQKTPKESIQQKQIGEEIPSGSGSGIHTIQKGNNAKFGNSDISTSGCGPAAAATVLKAYGINADLKNAAKYAEDRNYVTDTASRYTASGTTGTKASYFSDIFGANGIGTDYTDNKSAIQSAIDMGSPTVLLGQDTMNHSKSNSPFGPNPHYVVAQGKDKFGNIIVDDPELNKTTTYRQNILDNTSLGILTGGNSNIKSEKNNLFVGPIQPEFIGPISPEQSAFEKDPRTSYIRWSKLTPRQQIELIKKIAKANGIKETADKKEILTENNILNYFFPNVKTVQGHKLYTSDMKDKARFIKRVLEKEISASTNDVVVNDYIRKKAINKYKNKDKNPITKPDDLSLEDDGLVNITNDDTASNNEEENEESGGLLGYIGKFFNTIRDTVSNSNLSDREKKYINLVFSTDFMGNKSSNNTKGEFNDDGTAAYGNYADGSLPYKPMDSYEDFVNMSETDKSWFRLGGSKNNAQWNDELIDGNTTPDKAMIGNRSTLPNCVGWAWGRFNWIYHQLTGDKKKYVVSGDACELYDKAHTIGLKTNKTEPQPGAIMCFRSNSSDGHPGHVAIVEQVLNNGNKIIISESQWTNKTMFAKYVIERNDRPGAMWTYSSGYIFQGFIYNPGVEKWIRQCEKNKDINQGTLENRCRVIWAVLQRELEKLGYDNDYIVAGFMGNIWIESGRTMLASVMEGQLGINSKEAHNLRLKCKSRSTLAGNLKDIDNYTRTYISTSSGYKYDKWYLCGLGLVQWTASRAYNLLQYAYQESGGKHWTRLDTQIEYLIRKELSLGYKSILENLKNVKSAEEAAEYICLHFERPADPDATMTERQNKAKEFYSKYCKTLRSKAKWSGSGSGLESIGSNDFNKSLTEYAKTSRNNVLKEISSTKKDFRSTTRYSNKPSKTPIIDFTKKSNYSKSFDNSQLTGYGSGSSTSNRYNQKQSKYNNYSIHNDPYSYGGIGSGSGRPSVKNNNSRLSHQYQQTASSSTYNISKNNNPNYINSLIDLSKVITYLETIATNTKYNILLSKLVEILEKRAIESGTTLKTKSNKPFLAQNIDRAITSNQINIEDELSLILEKMSRIVSR